MKKKDLDDISVITADRLRKFNVAHGTVAGNVLDEIAAREAATEGELDDPELAQAQVEEDANEDPEFDREEERDEVHSQ